jgi:hypothetical protein
MKRFARKAILLIALAVAVSGLVPMTESAVTADEIVACAVGPNTGCIVCIVRMDNGRTKVVVYACP